MIYRIVVCGVLAATPLSTVAQNLPLRDPYDALQRERDTRRREDALRQVFPDVVRPAVPSEAATPSRMLGYEVDGGPRFLVTSIVPIGDTLLPQATLSRLVSPFQGHPLGVGQINQLLDQLNQALIEAGFTTSRAYVGPQNLQEGILEVTFVAGRVESIQIGHQRFETAAAMPLGWQMVLPFKPGDILRLADIEQAVDQASRVHGATVQVQILPGQASGGSTVAFQRQLAVNEAGVTPRAPISVTIDNQGSSSTGPWRSQFGTVAGDVLGLSESYQLGLTTSRDTNALFGMTSLPWGYNTWSLMGSASEYQNLIGDAALVYGTSGSVAVAFNRLVARDSVSKTAIDVSLTRRHSRRMINNASLTPQAQTVFRVGVNRLTRWSSASTAGQWTWDAGVARGLSSLGADRDAEDRPPDAARAQFTKADLSASADLRSPRGGLLRTRLSGQWTRQPLFSSEQLLAGGHGSVRGLPESALAGDRGLVWRNEWHWARNQPTSTGAAYAFEPFVFLDAARVQLVADRSWQGALSAGLGARARMPVGQIDLMLGRPLRLRAPSVTPSWRLHVQAQFSL